MAIVLGHGVTRKMQKTRGIQHVQDVSSICVGARGTATVLLRVCEQCSANRTGYITGRNYRRTSPRVLIFHRNLALFRDERPTTTRVWRTESIMVWQDAGTSRPHPAGTAANWIRAIGGRRAVFGLQRGDTRVRRKTGLTIKINRSP